jgi:ABC-type lipoprotein export system ATPase subunit
MSEPVVEAHALEKWYGSPARALPVLRGVELSIAAGEMVALRGPSGSGKSTLLNILGCLDRPSRGSYRLGGADVSLLERREQAFVRLRYIGFVFQSFHLLARSTAAENVMLPLHYLGLPRETQASMARQLLARVGLSARESHLPAQLSGGERQRVAIARALACHPRLLLADEPTGALDTRTGREILELLKELQNAEGLTVILVTHDPSVAARADRQIHLLDGQIVTDVGEQDDRTS